MKKPMNSVFAEEKKQSNGEGNIGIVGSIPVISLKQKHLLLENEWKKPWKPTKPT